ncbi:MAG TPA: hypothetical protein VK050_02250 [Flavobacteriaceae bacterium]|nr:hypothetical protein [Flavobacteriaceae bacterium]
MSNSSLRPEVVAIIAYLTPFGLIAAYFLNKNKGDIFAGFHVKNMFGITLLHYIGVLFGSMGLGVLHEVLFFISILSWILSFVRVLLKQMAGVPYLDQLFQQWFKFLD